MPLPRAIVDLEEYKESFNTLLYGPSNSGKTTLASQVDNNLILAVEKGTVSGARSVSKGKNVKVWPINSVTDMLEAYEYLKPGNHPFKYITVDTATAMQVMFLQEILEQQHRKNPEKFDRDVAQLQDYLKWQNKFKRFVNDFNDLSVNTIWIAHSMEYENADGDVETLPMLEGKEAKMARFMCATMDVVAHYYKKIDKPVKNGKEIVTPAITRRRLLFNEAGGRFAKDRFGVFGTYVDITIGDDQVNNLNDLLSRVDNPNSTKVAVSGTVSPVTSATNSEGDQETQETPSASEQQTEKPRKFRAVSNDED